MKKTILILLLQFALCEQSLLNAQVPVTQHGRIVRHENFPSVYIPSRNIDVWLPANYSPQKKYAVLYMHDGQMLFDSTATWNKQEWGVDEVLSSLLEQKKIQDCIVVGIWNGGKSRHAEYFPQKPFESLSITQQDFIFDAKRTGGQSAFNGIQIYSDRYLTFLVQELKPFIDRTYATKPDRAHTLIAGSSMGGLISIYALCEYPNVFGAAACLSTHWPGIFTLDNNPIPDAFILYLGRHLPVPEKNRIYFDYGTETLDALYPALQTRVDSLLMKKGYTSKQWITRSWPGQDHSERSWHSRLATPLLFLLGL